MDIKVGVTFEVVIPKFPGYKETYTITSTTVKNDSYGTIQIDKIAAVAPHTQDKTFKLGEAVSVVEKLWFDSEFTGRKFKVL